MDIALQPEVYKPSLDNNGNYIDSLLSFNLEMGIVCPCMPGKDRVFKNKTKFNYHKKTQTHQRWLEKINTEKNNLFVENIKLKELVETQKKLLAQFDIEIMKKNAIIEFLSSKTKSGELKHETINLIDI